MKRFLMIMVVAAVFMATSAQAERSKWYLAANGGVSFTDDFDNIPGLNFSFKTGYNVGGAVGYDMGKFRAEGEFTYRSVDVDTVNGIPVPVDADLSSLSFMVNGYYDIEMDSMTPYLGVGLGVVDSELQVAGLGTANETDMGYQFMAGLAFNVSKSAYLTGGYRFFGIAESGAPNTHEFTFGARFMF